VHQQPLNRGGERSVRLKVLRRFGLAVGGDGVADVLAPGLCRSHRHLAAAERRKGSQQQDRHGYQSADRQGALVFESQEDCLSAAYLHIHGPASKYIQTPRRDSSTLLAAAPLERLADPRANAINGLSSFRWRGAAEGSFLGED
jgi:hypothetical protein